jgi:hypothetical protein
MAAVLYTPVLRRVYERHIETTTCASKYLQSCLVVCAGASNPNVTGSSPASALATLCDYQRPSAPVRGRMPAGQCSPCHQSRSDGSHVRGEGDHRRLALVNMHFIQLYIKKAHSIPEMINIQQDCVSPKHIST